METKPIEHSLETAAHSLVETAKALRGESDYEWPESFSDALACLQEAFRQMASQQENSEAREQLALCSAAFGHAQNAIEEWQQIIDLID